jgi:hypothetical protein
MQARFLKWWQKLGDEGIVARRLRERREARKEKHKKEGRDQMPWWQETQKWWQDMQERDKREGRDKIPWWAVLLGTFALLYFKTEMEAWFWTEFLLNPPDDIFRIRWEDVGAREVHTKMVLAYQRQQDADLSAFAVAVGSHRSPMSRKPASLIVSVTVREQACATSLLVVGADMLTLVSAFLNSGEVKLKFQHKWKVPDECEGEAVWSCHISPCGNVAMTCAGHSLHLWDTVRKETLAGPSGRTLTGHDKNVRSCRFFPDGKSVVSVSNDKTLKVWDVASGSLVRTMVGHAAAVVCVDVAPDGTILSGSYDGTAKMWNFTTGEEMHTLYPRRCPVCCSFSPNGEAFILGVDSVVELYNSKAPIPHQRAFEGHTSNVMSCAFAPDGATIVSSSWDSTMKLWSTATGQILHTLVGHSSDINVCFFSRSGRTVVSGSSDRTLRLWVVATGALQRIFECDAPVASACISQDGKYILSGHLKKPHDFERRRHYRVAKEHRIKFPKAPDLNLGQIQGLWAPGYDTSKCFDERPVELWRIECPRF